MSLNRILLKFIASLILPMLIVMSVGAAEVTYIAEHNGIINGENFSASLAGSVNSTTGDASATIDFQAMPSYYHPAHSGFSLLCISCSNSGRPRRYAVNFYDVLSGYGNYTHFRTYHYEGYPEDSLTVEADFELAYDTLHYTATWGGYVSNLPDNIVDISEYKQLLTPKGNGVVEVTGNGYLLLSDGDSLSFEWTGEYNLGPGHDLPFAEEGTIDLDFTSNNDTYYLTGTSFVDPVAGAPALTTWGLIALISLLLISVFIILAKRKGIHSY